MYFSYSGAPRRLPTSRNRAAHMSETFLTVMITPSAMFLVSAGLATNAFMLDRTRFMVRMSEAGSEPGWAGVGERRAALARESSSRSSRSC